MNSQGTQQNKKLQVDNTQKVPMSSEPIQSMVLPTENLITKSQKFLAESKSQSPQVAQNVGQQQNKSTSVKGMSNILDALYAKGLISNDQFNQAKFEAINTGKKVEEVLIQHGFVSSKDIAKTLSEMRGIGFADLKNMIIDIETLHTLPAEVAKSNMSIVFEVIQNTVKLAMKDPLDLQKIKYLESLLGKRIEPYYATTEDIQDVIENRYGAQLGDEVGQAMQEVGDFSQTTNIISSGAETSSADAAPIIRIVSMILDYGVKNKASDIHIEPREENIAVRFRIRGILSEKLNIPRKLLPAVVTRIKILSNLKIDEHRIPQDGRFQHVDQGAAIDIRVSIMPGVHGEKIVMRLLEKSSGIMALEDTGLSGVSYNRLKDSLKRTQGVILVTGPTGSGKTQTLASCLKILNTSQVNIITLEDPVEIKIEGVNQTQVNPEVGLTFASGLRSILRQDPDIVMVGEIRDSETANLAIQAALIGRLVLSTIHTNSAAGAFARLMDMGVEPFLLTSTINVVLAQRLVRVLCECKEAYQANPEMLAILHNELDRLGDFKIYDAEHNLKLEFTKNSDNITLFRPKGCPKCNDTGYSSRIGIFEALKLSENINKAVVEKQTISKINQISIDEGMVTLVQDGFLKTLQGITTIEEVLRVKNE